ncbi:MAG: type IV pilus assembly protein PilM [Neisseria sp.]|nr:type IV pilus assembly protein PilM [Neisseria sp.]
MRLGSKIGKKPGKATVSLGGRTFVGIDISDHSVKMVQISGRSPEQVKVEGCAITPLPTGAVVDGKVANVDDLVVTLQQTASRMGGISKNVIAGMPNAIVTVQNFSYDPASGMDLNGAAEFEAAQISVIDDINYDYQAIGYAQGSEQNVMLALAKKEDIEPYFGALEDAGLELSFADVETAARINAYSLWINTHSSDLENSVVAVFDIGEENTQALVLQAGNILFKQDFPVGGKHLSREIQRTYQVGLDEAEHMKMSANKPHDYKVVADSFNGQIAQEVQRVLQFFYTLSTSGGSQKVERIFLTGGGSQCNGLAENITAHSSVPTQALHPFEHVSVSGKVNQDQLRQNAARYTVALGLALRGLA